MYMYVWYVHIYIYIYIYIGYGLHVTSCNTRMMRWRLRTEQLEIVCLIMHKHTLRDNILYILV